MKLVVPFCFLSLAVFGCGGKEVGTSTDIAPDGCPHYVTQGNPGRLLIQPAMHFDFWGSYWSAGTVFEQSQYESAWTTLMGGHVLDRLAEYGIHDGELNANSSNNSFPDAKNVVTDAGVLQMIDDKVIAPKLVQEIQFSYVPFPTDDTLYVVMLPPGMTTNNLFYNGWSGYHGHAFYGKQRFTYAIIGYSTDQNYTNISISHELYEAATDPDGTEFFQGSDGEEVGDLCNRVPTSIDGLVVEKVWSQGSCTCL